MKKKTKTGLGCFFLLLFLLLLVVLMSLFREEYDRFFKKEPEPQGITWASAMKICKEKYKSLGSPARINVPNSKKRTESELEHIFHWSRPVGIFIKEEADTLTVSNGICVVSKESGEITYISLNDTVIVGEE